MQFLFQPLTWGFLLVLAPVLIHLINMLRHQRVKWAAMDFLLKSYKKHRRWVWLKQMALLLSRMAAVALLVMMLAQWMPRGGWLDQFGGKTTHHVVLLDDSLSMHEQARSDDATAFEAGWRVIDQLGRLAEEDRRGRHRFTLLRFSSALRGSEADLSDVIVDSEFSKRLETLRQQLEPSQLAVGPGPALQIASKLVQQSPDQSHVVYLVSDLRENQWESPAEYRDALQQIERGGADIEIVACARGASGNLAITAIQPDSGARAAGVPLFVNVHVKNFGRDPVRNVPLKLKSFFYSPKADAAAPGKTEPVIEELPLEKIDLIGPGETVQRRVQLYFSDAGQHAVQADLPDDECLPDNRRTEVIEFQASEQMLVIDGDPQQSNAFFLESIFRPGGRAETGVTPIVEGVEFLRDATRDQLRSFASIFLCDVPSLETRAIESLTRYVEEGGGLAFFVGPQVSIAHYKQALYQEGQGLFPAPLERDAMLLPPINEETPHVSIVEEHHSLFRELLLGRNPVIRLVKVDRYLQPSDNWSADAQPEVRVLARLHNNDPWVLEKRIGAGRVVAFLSTYSPQWNDMVLGPNVLVALKLQAHLAETRRQAESRLVGSALDLEVNGRQQQPSVSFVIPGRRADNNRVVERTAESSEDGSLLTARLFSPDAPEGETDRPGIYEAWAPNLEGGGYLVRRFALNVDTAESELASPTSQQLLAALDPISVEYRSANDIGLTLAGHDGFNPSLWIMGLVILVLAAEQLLAYANTYHPPRGAAG